MPLSLLAVGAAVLVFFRMSAGGQFDDAEGPAWSVLMDDDRAPARHESPRPRPIDAPLMEIKNRPTTADDDLCTAGARAPARPSTQRNPTR